MINQYLNHFIQKGFIFFILIFLNFGILSAQQTKKKDLIKSSALIQFSKDKSESWKLEKFKADSQAKILKMPLSYTESMGRMVILQRLGYRNKPVYYATDNLNSAQTISVDKLWTDENDYPSLNGEGVAVNIWDGGSILSTHQEFQIASESRILMRDRDISLSNHSTHIAGTIGAAGFNPIARGMAGNASLYGWDMNNDLAEMSMVAVDGAVVSNHSYGPLCGWYYNSTTGNWYWYGDITISTTEDYEFGFYNQTSADLDYLAWTAPEYLIVKSAGNDRNDAPTEQPVNHYVWDGAWQYVNNVLRDPDGGIDGYDCLSPMSVSKNILTVGAVDDVKNMTSFSAYGPTDDGRIKPDVTANGQDVYSSIGSAINAYGTYDGTSMAAASVTGSVALVHNLQEIVQPGVQLLSSTIKGLLIHTSDESGSNPGPDYIFGWGILNLKTACDLIFNNAGNGGNNIKEGFITKGETINLPIITTDSSPFLKITICWTDPPGEPSNPSLNPRDAKLVNDINIELENLDNHNIYYPWTLDVENPESPAIQGINHIDNVEQIYLPNPGTENFNLKISHSGTLSGDSQQYSLFISGNSTYTEIFPPNNLKYNCNESLVQLKWTPSESSLPIKYKVYRNNSFLALATDTFYYDNSVITDAIYEYYITAVYEISGVEIESIGTNCLTICPRSLRPLPFIEDFEEMPTEVIIQNSDDSWKWGDSESLSCYYLDFSENVTNFIGADSYSAGRLAHVMDVAETMPLRLAEYTNITVSFDYILNTGIYDAIDELHLLYKLPEEEDWTEWENLSRAIDWKSETYSLPEQAYKNGTIIGFYFDDFYQWGLGAGLDNIQITGTPTRSIDLEANALISPVSSCTLSVNEPVVFAIRNAGDNDALAGDQIAIQMNISNGQSILEEIVLSGTISKGELFVYQMSTPVDFSNIGTYDISFQISCSLDHNEFNNSLETSVEVLGNPNTQILNQDQFFCETDQQILIEVSPSGGILTGAGIDGLYFNPSLAGVGKHIITYTYADANGCENLIEKEFEVLPLPQPKILNQDKDFCESDADILIEVEPAGGIISGDGISGSYFNPTIAGTGSHVITYTFSDQNGCENSASVVFTVLPGPIISIINQDLSFCENDPGVLIEVAPPGGILEGPGISGLYFNPTEAGEGDHIISYSLSDENGCEASTSIEFTVLPVPMISILNQDFSFCVKDPEILIEVEPPGGILEGPGISGLYFNPTEAGEGDHIISYSLSDANGCEASTSIEFTVLPVPVISILNQDLSFCESDQEVLIEVEPAGGILEGPGIADMYFNPTMAGCGTHIISYSYTNTSGCSSSIQTQVEVFENPMVNLGPDQKININNTIELIPEGNGSSFIWHDGSTDDKLIIVAQNLGIGTHDIWVKAYSNQQCSAVDSLLLTIDMSELNISTPNSFNPMVVPNPFKNGFYLVIEKQERLKNLILYGTNGHVILNYQSLTHPYYDVSFLPSGVYFLKVETVRQIVILKILKM